MDTYHILSNQLEGDSVIFTNVSDKLTQSGNSGA